MFDPELFDWFYPDGRKVKGAGSYLAFDIETDGLLPDVSTIHSLVIKDLVSGEVWSAAQPDSKEKPNPTGPSMSTWALHDYVSMDWALRKLAGADIAFGHNIIGYDIPVLQHLHSGWELEGIPRDTLLMAKMIWPMDNLKQLDYPRWRKGKLPGQLIGAHKLEAWGYRLGLQKGEYSKAVKELSKEYSDHGDLSKIPEDYHVLAAFDDKGKPCLKEWSAWNKPMQDYCETDVEVTAKLLELIQGHLVGTSKASNGVGWSPRSIKLEHDVWSHCLDQEKRGYGYDLEGAVKLTSEMKTRQRELERQLKEAFGSWWHPLSDPKHGERPARAYAEGMKQFPDVTIKRFSKKTGKEIKPYVGPPKCGYSPDAPFVRVRWTEFNPKSRQHLGERLQKVFGWVPVEFGGKNNDQAKVDETTIKDIPNSVLPDSLKTTILEYLVIAKTLGQMADGRKSWNDLCAEDGRLHGRVDPLGTVSHRGSHRDPNLAQVPSVSLAEEKDSNGKVISSRIITGWKGGFGSECRSLFRPGRDGWPQTGTDASGLELRILGHYLEPYDGGEFMRRVCTPGLDIHKAHGEITGLSRADTKTVTYAYIYGAGGLLIGIAVGVPDEEIEVIANSPEAKRYLAFMKKTFRDFQGLNDKQLAHTIRGNQVKKKFANGITGLIDLQNDLKGEATRNGFIVALDGRKLSIRKKHATLNQALQGGGAIICKKWMMETDAYLKEQGLKPDKDYGQMAWVHDELQFEHRPGLEDVIKEASLEGMRRTQEYYDFKGELTTDSKSGANWCECH